MIRVKIEKSPFPEKYEIGFYWKDHGQTFVDKKHTIGIIQVKSLKTQIEKLLKKAPIKIASRKGKARNLQKWIAKKISGLTGIPCGKDQLIESREMGQTGVDVKLIGEAKKQFPFSIECKAQEKLNIHGAIKQAKENQMKGTSWLVFSKRNNEKPIVTMDAEEFFNIYKLLLKRCDQIL